MEQAIQLLELLSSWKFIGIVLFLGVTFFLYWRYGDKKPFGFLFPEKTSLKDIKFGYDIPPPLTPKVYSVVSKDDGVYKPEPYYAVFDVETAILVFRYNILVDRVICLDINSQEWGWCRNVEEAEEFYNAIENRNELKTK